jgi:GTP-binding protein
MEISTVYYTGSFPDHRKAPEHQLPEYAFIGRSNVGKSSLINMLCNRKDLARTSSSPGKTQMLNFYHVDQTWYLVDLPGYGYARVSQTQRQKFSKMIEGYLQQRSNLSCAFVLIDSNIPPQAKDLEFMNWLGAARIPFAIVYTKCDRLSKPKLEENLKRIQGALLETWESLPQEFITSAEKATGRKEILEFIAATNVRFHESE